MDYLVQFQITVPYLAAGVMLVLALVYAIKSLF